MLWQLWCWVDLHFPCLCRACSARTTNDLVREKTPVHPRPEPHARCLHSRQRTSRRRWRPPKAAALQLWIGGSTPPSFVLVASIASVSFSSSITGSIGSGASNAKVDGLAILVGKGAKRPAIILVRWRGRQTLDQRREDASNQLDEEACVNLKAGDYAISNRNARSCQHKSTEVARYQILRGHLNGGIAPSPGSFLSRALSRLCLQFMLSRRCIYLKKPIGCVFFLKNILQLLAVRPLKPRSGVMAGFVFVYRFMDVARAGVSVNQCCNRLQLCVVVVRGEGSNNDCHWPDHVLRGVWRSNPGEGNAVKVLWVSCREHPLPCGSVDCFVVPATGIRGRSELARSNVRQRK